MDTNPVRGIVAMLAAVAAFASMDAVLKLLAPHYPALELAALRGASSLPFVLASVLLLGRLRDLRPVRWRLHLARGLLAVVMLAGFIHSVRLLSLADAYTVFFVAPLLVTAFAVPILGETVDRQRWLAIGGGLSGVVFILDPSAAALTSLGALGALASATAYALSAILVRLMVRTDTSASMVFSMLLLLSVFAGALAAPHWQPVRAQDWPWITVLGVTGGLGQFFITRAFVHAPASLVAPFEYTALVWALAIDWAFWNVVPGGRLFAGSAIIIGSGLYLLRRERALHKEIAASIESPASLH